ncbi:MAG: RNA-directed DNA polymerase, partial [Candidatus Berkelbacteria bacterium Licking1014_96]
MKIYRDIFAEIICLENLFLSWEEFKKDKQNKKDVLTFEWNLEPNIINLYRDLKYHRYKHGVYTPFDLYDPKPRKVHKATVRDRILHHAVFRILNPIFEPTFISHSFSCQLGKGTHKGVSSLAKILIKTSQNHHYECFALKCDIKKFFASIDHQILLSIIKKRIKDEMAIWLVEEIISSFSAETIREREREREQSLRPRFAHRQSDQPDFCQ